MSGEKNRSRLWPWTLGVVIVGGIALTAFCMLSVVIVTTLGASASFGQKAAVAIIRVEGRIMAGESPGGFSSAQGAFAQDVIANIRKARNDSSVRAVILRVDSPGGSVVASDEIYEELRKMDKPLIASMGEMAASGGYYISAAADKIVANPATLTGSIGVIAMTPNMEELLEKIGVEMIIIKTGPHKDTLSGFRDLTEEEREIWQEIIADSFNEFVQVVTESREMKVGTVRDLADGRLYTGKQAQELGLVDELGNLPDAIDLAARRGGIEGAPRIIEYQRAPTFFEAIFGMLTLGRQISIEDILTTDRRMSLQYLYVEP